MRPESYYPVTEKKETSELVLDNRKSVIALAMKQAVMIGTGPMLQDEDVLVHNWLVKNKIYRLRAPSKARQDRKKSLVSHLGN